MALFADDQLIDRKPTPADRGSGQHLLEAFKGIFPEAKRFVISLAGAASGDATLFRDGIGKILS
jgi:hypothetical protein